MFDFAIVGHAILFLPWAKWRIAAVEFYRPTASARQFNNKRQRFHSHSLAEFTFYSQEKPCSKQGLSEPCCNYLLLAV